jgi:hypothetical protein
MRVLARAPPRVHVAGLAIVEVVLEREVAAEHELLRLGAVLETLKERGCKRIGMMRLPRLHRHTIPEIAAKRQRRSRKPFPPAHAISARSRSRRPAHYGRQYDDRISLLTGFANAIM